MKAEGEWVSSPPNQPAVEPRFPSTIAIRTTPAIQSSHLQRPLWADAQTLSKHFRKATMNRESVAACNRKQPDCASLSIRYIATLQSGFHSLTTLPSLVACGRISLAENRSLAPYCTHWDQGMIPPFAARRLINPVSP